jgi:hypothetical protein
MYFPYLFSDFDKIRYFISACDAVKLLWVSWKSSLGKPYISCGCKQNITAKRYNISEIKNAMVKPFYCIMDYTSCYSVTFIINVV